MRSITTVPAADAAQTETAKTPEPKSVFTESWTMTVLKRPDGATLTIEERVWRAENRPVWDTTEEAEDTLPLVSYIGNVHDLVLRIQRFYESA